MHILNLINNNTSNKQLLTGKAQAQRKGKKELWQEVNQTWKYGKQIQRG